MITAVFCSILSYKFLKDKISFQQTKFRPHLNETSFRGSEICFVKMIFRFVETKFHFVEAKLCSNDTKFCPSGMKFPYEVSSHTAKFPFDSSHCLQNFANIRTIEGQKFRHIFIWNESLKFDCRNSRHFTNFCKFHLHFFCTVL